MDLEHQPTVSSHNNINMSWKGIYVDDLYFATQFFTNQKKD